MTHETHKPGEITLLVRDKRPVASSVVEVTLVAEDPGLRLDAWHPGSHIGLRLPSGLIRQYSLCGGLHDPSAYTIAVLREPAGRGGSAYVHDELHPGDQVLATRPNNNFELVDAVEYLFIAGGIGLTPLLSMIDTVDAQEKPWRLIYGGKSRESMAYVERLEARYGPRVRALPQDQHGLLPVDELIGQLKPDEVVYCCGPEPLLSAVEAACRALSIDRLHVERFAPSANLVELGRGDHAFDVVLGPGGAVLRVGSDQTILEVLEQAGVPVDSSCREGTCGTCETGVLEGKPEHRDSLLSEDEREAGDTMFICCSRAVGDRLVLDL
jgi:ferredoxin-NADP reductase